MVDLVLEVIRFVEPVFLSFLEVILAYRLDHVVLLVDAVQLSLPEFQVMSLLILISERVVLVLLLDELLGVDHLPPQLGVVVPPHFARILIGCHLSVLIYFIVRLLLLII